MKFFVIPIFLSIFATAIYSSDLQNGRIVGGKDAERRQFPYMVSFQKLGKLWCGGGIVSKSWVVSAAHCFDTIENQRNLLAVASLLHFGENHPDVQSIPVGAVINHPEYVNIPGFVVNNDISMLKLASPLTFTAAVQPLSLPLPHEEASGNAWLSGWGIFEVPSTIPSTLQCLEMPVVTNEECREKLSKFPQAHVLLDTMVCVVPPTRDETGCYGDSGSPLTQNGTLVGITSWLGAACGLPDVPTVFTRASSYIDFITEHAKDD